MELSVPLFEGLSLRIADQSAGATGYPTARLQKGLLLLDGDEDLAEEGVGFGVPILKRGTVTVFPGDVELAWRRDGPVWEVTAAFQMNLVERLAGRGGDRVKSRRSLRRQERPGRAAPPFPFAARPADRRLQRPAAHVRLGDHLREDGDLRHADADIRDPRLSRDESTSRST